MRLLIARPLARLAAVALPLGFAAALQSAGAQDAPKPAAVYSDEQAERGNGIFSRTCVECHTRKDMSNADFRVKWNGRAVFDLFDLIRTTMPEATPGSMTPAEYAEVTSYFLKLNGMPAGSMPMPADSTLRDVKIDIPATPPPGGASQASVSSHVQAAARARTSPHAAARSLSSYTAYTFSHTLRRGL